MNTSAPSSRNRAAISLPSPVPPPVTRMRCDLSRPSWNMSRLPLQNRDRLDLKQRTRARQRRNADRSARRRRRHVEVAVAHFAEGADVARDVDQVIVDLDDVLELGTDRGERILQVLERLDGLAAEISRHVAGWID